MSLDSSVDKLLRSFPAEPSDRPPKLAFGKRLSSKLTPRIGKRKHARAVSSPDTPDDSFDHVPTPDSFTHESQVADHVRTREITSQPAPRVLLKARPETPQSDLVRPGRNFSIISLAFPEPHIEYPTSPQPPSRDQVQLDEQGDVPRLHRKEPPQLTVRDTLVEHLEKLRLPNTSHAPLASAGLPTSSSSTNFSLPLQPSNSTRAVAVKAAWNRMTVSNHILPSFREQSRSYTDQMEANHPRRGQTLTDPIVIEDNGEYNTTVGPNRATGNFENTNFFQSSGLSRQSLNRRRTRKERFLRKKPDRQSQSPGASSSSSEGKLTPDSSESDLPTRVAQVESKSSIRTTGRTRGLLSPEVNPGSNAQEEQDRLLAKHLQRREDEAYRTAASNLTEGLRSSPRVLSRRTGRLASLRRAITHIGTREDPIDIDSDTDDPKAVVPERARIEDYVALYGEPMEVDGVWLFHQDDARLLNALQPANTYADERTHLRRRDCVVCGDSVHVVDVPSLANCDHRPETCADCYLGWITAQLQGNSWREAKCPGNKCKTVLSHNEIRLYADPEIFQQYDTFIARAAFTEDRKSSH